MKIQHADNLRHIAIPPNTDEIAFLTKTDSKVKKWAFANAYMLIFLSCMFAITWVIYLVVDLTH